MRIRQMTEKDVPTVALIERDCFSEPWSEQGFLDGMANSTVFFAAEDDRGNVVGYIGMYLMKPEGEITNVAVAKEVRGRGIGAALVAAMQLKGSCFKKANSPCHISVSPMFS